MWALEPGSANMSPLQTDTRCRTDRLNVSPLTLFFRFALVESILGTLSAMGKTQYEAILDDNPQEDDDWLSTRAGYRLVWKGPWDACLKISAYLWDMPDFALSLGYRKGHKRAMRQIEEQAAQTRTREIFSRTDTHTQEEDDEASSAVASHDPATAPSKKLRR